uniref:Dipeptidyl-peptidase V n=1 Tax=Kwoniella bestiolae CBS 10118 TaxID=1296100 RepID=A0A1B9G3G3_9TREE|nr:hypothetical protein I302_05395 [Kwoniella bestiolae CBS 10118]OCF25575.1 hypothetical protein I302_05395 [Kwoniella bestiolae CBS 10118]
MTLTYQDLVAAPRLQAGIPSPDGKRVLNVLDQWDEDKQEMSRKVYLVVLPPYNDLTKDTMREDDMTSISKAEIILLLSCLAKEAKSLFWLSDHAIGYFSDLTIKYFDLSRDLSAPPATTDTHRELTTFPKGIDPSFIAFERTTGLLAFRAQVWEGNGDFERLEEEEMKPVGAGSGVRYDELYVRYKDKWRVPGKVYTIGLVGVIQEDGKWTIGDIKGQRNWNVLKYTGLYSQIPSFSADTVTLNPSRLVIATRPPRLNPAIHTRMDIYVFTLQPHSDSPICGQPINLTSKGSHGEVEFLSSSEDGNQIVWTEREIDGNEASKRLASSWDFTLGQKTRWVEGWDASPSKVQFSIDGKSLFWLSEIHGRILPYFISGPNQQPIPLHHQGVTDSLNVLDERTILISKSDMFNPLSDYLLRIPQEGDTKATRIVQLTDWSSSFLGDKLDGLKLEEYWFEGVDERRVMGWTVKPKGFDESEIPKKTYPMPLSGGPQSACRDMWIIRWNLLLYASYGYFVLSINPTGSTGYGQDFVDRLRYEFGGRDVSDLERGYKAILAQYPQIDPERTAALGPSSGGQLIHRINGCNDCFGFKALVCHAGIFEETTLAYETDFQAGDYNPAKYLNKWETPTLVVHGGKGELGISSDGF